MALEYLRKHQIQTRNIVPEWEHLTQQNQHKLHSLPKI